MEPFSRMPTLSGRLQPKPSWVGCYQGGLPRDASARDIKYHVLYEDSTIALGRCQCLLVEGHHGT